MKNEYSDFMVENVKNIYNTKFYPLNGKSLPKSWQAKDKYKFIRLQDSFTTISFTNNAHDYKSFSHDEAIVFKADLPISVNLGVYYFEVMLTNIPEDSTICIGVAKYCAPSNKTLGTDSNSWALKSSDGFLYHSATILSPKITTKISSGDIVGVGVDFISQNLFYTLNGELISKAFENKFRIPCTKFEVYPSVSLQPVNQCKGAKTSANFGQKPFLYNISKHVNHLRSIRELSLIKDYSPNNKEHSSIINKFILKYLIYHGYVSTVEDFSKYFPKNDKTLESNPIASIRKRQELIKQCESKNFVGLLSNLENNFPDVVQKFPELIVQLKCHQFVHYGLQDSKQNGNTNQESSVLEKIEFGRKLVDQVRELKSKQGFISLDTLKIFEQSISLLAYRDPKSSECPLKNLFDPFWQKLTSSVVNHAIMSSKDPNYEKFPTCIDQVYDLFKKTITDTTFVEGQSLGKFMLIQVPYEELSRDLRDEKLPQDSQKLTRNSKRPLSNNEIEQGPSEDNKKLKLDLNNK